MYSYKRVSEQEFLKIKALLDKGLTANSIVALQKELGLPKRSSSSYSYFKRSNTMEDYRKLVNSVHQLAKARKEEKTKILESLSPKEVPVKVVKEDIGITQPTSEEKIETILAYIHNELKTINQGIEQLIKFKIEQREYFKQREENRRGWFNK